MIRLLVRLSFGVILLCGVVGAVADAADADGHEKKKAVAVQRNKNISEGSTSSGVSVEGLAVVVEAGAGSPGQSGRNLDCSWGVMYDPNTAIDSPFVATLGPYRIGLSRQQGVPESSLMGPLRYPVDRLNETDEFAQQGQDVTQLRYVYNYGPDCAQLVQAWITLADVEAVAQLAFDDLQRTWPVQDVALGWPVPVEDTWTALRTSLSWQPISATASDGGITVTVTATPVQTVWDIGEINARYGGTTEVSCAGPGDMPADQELASCKVWFAGPSTGLSDRNGVGDTTSLGLTVVWVVGYTSTFGSDPAWLIWPTSSQLDALRVVTSQSVNVDSGGS